MHSHSWKKRHCFSGQFLRRCWWLPVLYAVSRGVALGIDPIQSIRCVYHRMPACLPAEGPLLLSPQRGHFRQATTSWRGEAIIDCHDARHAGRLGGSYFTCSEVPQQPVRRSSSGWRPGAGEGPYCWKHRRTALPTSGGWIPAG